MKNKIFFLLVLLAATFSAAAEIVTVMDPLTTKRPYLPRKKSGYALVSNIEKIAYTAYNTSSCIHFTPVNPRHKPVLYLALPKAIKLEGVFRWIDLQKNGSWQHNGEEFDLYCATPQPKASKYTFVWKLTRQLPAGTKLKGYYWGKYAKGEQAPQLLDIQVVDIPEVKGLAKLPVYWSMPGDFFAMLPEFDSIKKCGINHIDIWAYMNPDEAQWGSGNLAAIAPKAARSGIKQIAWIQEWWWAQGQKSDGAAIMADGSKNTSQLCPSYRGEWYKKLIESGKMIIDRGIYFHSTDPEMYSKGDQLCCCRLCTDNFRKFLQQNHPELNFSTLPELAANPAANRLVYNAWRDFKTRQYAAFFGDYRKAMEDYMVQQGLDKRMFKFMIYSSYHRSFPGMYTHKDYRDSWTYNKGLEDPKHFIGIFDYLAPMSYTEVYANYQPYDMLTTWKDTVVQRKITNDQIPVAPILSTGYPFFYAFDCDINAEMLMYVIYEAIAGGAKGFGFWGECPLDANDMRAIALCVKSLQPCEDIIFNGRPDDSLLQADNAMVKCVNSPRGAWVLVSEYSKNPQNVTVKVKSALQGKVTDLASGQTIAVIDGNNRNFTVTLDKQRAKIFSITKE